MVQKYGWFKYEIVEFYFLSLRIRNMKYFLVGLGNTGEEYENTRHNVGRMLVDYFVSQNDFSDWKESKLQKASIAKAKIGKHEVLAITPTVFMNQSGKAVSNFVKNVKDASRLIVIYDDMDLPLGKVRISFGRSSGGHNGVESIIKSIKTKDFVRIRIGISPETASGKLKKPSGEDAVIKFILGKLRENDLEVLKKIRKKVNDAIQMIIEEGRERAMGEYN